MAELCEKTVSGNGSDRTVVLEDVKTDGSHVVVKDVEKDGVPAACGTEEPQKVGNAFNL